MSVRPECVTTLAEINLAQFRKSFSFIFEGKVVTARAVTSDSTKYPADKEWVEFYLNTDKEALQWLDDPRNKMSIEEYCFGKQRFLWIVEIDGVRVARTRAFQTDGQKFLAGEVWVSTYIIPDYRGRGLSILIKLALLQHLEKAGIKIVRSSVYLDNAVSIALNNRAMVEWEKMGGTTSSYDVDGERLTRVFEFQLGHV